MFKKLSILIALLLGLAINIAVYAVTVDIDTISTSSIVYDQPQQPFSLGICAAGSYNAVEILQGGLPLKSTKQIVVAVPYCTETNSDHSSITTIANNSKDFLKNWQFYANWLIWSLPFLLIAYLINNRRDVKV